MLRYILTITEMVPTENGDAIVSSNRIFTDLSKATEALDQYSLGYPVLISATIATRRD